MATKVYVEQAGCDRRQLDATTIRSFLEANGYALVNDPRKADKMLVVTCAFKEREEEESILRLRSLLKYGREIVVYGCLADIAAERYKEFSDLPSIPPRSISDIEQHFTEGDIPFADIPSANVPHREEPSITRIRRLMEAESKPLHEVLMRAGKFSAQQLAEKLVNHQEPFTLFVCRGCSGSCTYCAIKKAIGHVQSKPIEQVVRELYRGLENGHRSFSILGDDPGCYGHDLSTSLPELLGALFEASDSWNPRQRTRPNGEQPIAFHIRDIHPVHLIRYHEELLGLPGASRIEGVLCPLQSGSDRVLELMGRQHSTAAVLQAIQMLRACRPGITLDTQIIVGFPTEAETDFQQTLDFVTAARYDSVVVFPYDEKDGTAATRLSDKVPPEEIERRVDMAFKHFRREGIRAYASCPS